MQRLFADKFLDAEEHGAYNLYNARVKAHHPRMINPYLLGYTMFCDIEDRWNKGRFGQDWERERNLQAKENWDLWLGQGLGKIFDVRRTYMDWFFLDEFLTREIIEKLGLYVYVENDKDTYYKTVVEETHWRKVKRTLVQSMMNWGVPRVQLMDGNYQGSIQLYLSHAYEGLPLDDEYCRKTLENIFSLWGRPVYLETREPHNGSTSAKLYVIDGRGIHVRSD